MRKIYLFLAALSFTVAASAQNNNLYDPADCDADGWLWFDSQAKIDKYVGRANDDLGTWNKGGKLIQLSTTDFEPYNESFADPDFPGVGSDTIVGGEGAIKGGLGMPRNSKVLQNNGGRILFYLPSCKQMDIAFAGELSIRGRVSVTSDLEADFSSYQQKYASLFKGIGGATTYRWLNVQDKGFQSETPQVLSFQNGQADTIYIQAVRVFTYQPTDLGIEDQVQASFGMNVINRTVLLTEAQDIRVYNLSGNLVASVNKRKSLSLNHLPQGVYLVKAGKKSRKVILS